MKNKNITLLITLFVFLALASGVSAVGYCNGLYGIGDWLVNNTTNIKCNNTNIKMTGSLTIEGNLTLYNLTLGFNMSTDDQYYLNVTDTGKLVVNLSNISNYASGIAWGGNNTTHYPFRVEDGASLTIHDSIVNFTSEGINIWADDIEILRSNISNSTTWGLIVRSGANLATINDSEIRANQGGGALLYANNTTFHNNVVSSNTGSHVYISSGSHYNTISSCTINSTLSGSDHGIILFGDTTHNTISQNTIWTNCNNCDGINFANIGQYNNTIDGNAITTVHTTDSEGIYTTYSENNTISNNNVTSNKLGIFLDSESHYNNVTLNRFTDIGTDGVGGYTGHGIYLSNADYNSITENHVNNMSNHGIYILGDCQYNTFEKNNVSGATRGAFIYTTTVMNYFIGNNMSNNTDGAYLDTSSNQNWTSNMISGNTDGVYTVDSSNNLFDSNNITDNTNYGVYTTNSNITNFTNNKVYETNICFYTADGNSNYYFSNEINSSGSSDDYGIQITGTSDANNISSNTFYTACTNCDAIYNNGANVNATYIGANTITTRNSNSDGIYLYSTSGWHTVQDNTVTAFNDSIRVELTNNSIFRGNWLQHGSDDGFYVYDSGSNNFTNNTAYNNSANGFYITGDSASNRYTDNIVTFNRDGLYLLSITTSGNQISGNNVSNNTNYGFHLSGTTNQTIDNNTMYKNNHGAYVASVSSGNILSNNTISNSVQYGIFITTSNENDVFLNSFTSGTYGLYMYLSNTSNITDNNMSSTSRGIWLDNSSGSYISGNNGSSTVYDISINDTTGANTIVDNYLTANQGVTLDGVQNNNITNNTFQGCISQAVFLTNSDSNIVAWNVIDSSGDGVHIQTNSDNNNVSNNTITGSSIEGVDIVLNCDNNRVVNNTIDGEDSAHLGILITTNSDGTVVEDNNITRNTRYGLRIRWTSENTSITNTNISNNDMNVEVWTGNGTSFTNVTIDSASNSSVGYGVFLNDSHHVSLTGCTLRDNNLTGFYSLDSSDTNLTDSTVSGSDSYGAHGNNGNFTVYNSTVSGTLNDVWGEGTSNMTGVNVTTTSINMSGSAWFYKKWYVSVLVQDLSSNALSGASVYCFDNESGQEWSGTTNSNGRVNNEPTTERVFNSSGNTSMNQHTTNATLANYQTGISYDTFTTNTLVTISLTPTGTGGGGSSGGGGSVPDNESKVTPFSLISNKTIDLRSRLPDIKLHPLVIIGGLLLLAGGVLFFLSGSSKNAFRRLVKGA